MFHVRFGDLHFNICMRFFHLIENKLLADRTVQYSTAQDIWYMFTKKPHRIICSERLTQIIFKRSHSKWSWKVGVDRAAHVVRILNIIFNFIFGRIFVASAIEKWTRYTQLKKVSFHLNSHAYFHLNVKNRI